MKFPRGAARALRWGIAGRAEGWWAFDLVIGIGAVANRSAWWRSQSVTRRSVGAKGVAEFGYASAQFVVRAAKLLAALEFIGCKPEAREDCEQEKAVPELQSPADGFENHVQPSMQ
jgi:hypothetical protein